MSTVDLRQLGRGKTNTGNTGMIQREPQTLKYSFVFINLTKAEIVFCGGFMNAVEIISFTYFIFVKCNLLSPMSSVHQAMRRWNKDKAGSVSASKWRAFQ